MTSVTLMEGSFGTQLTKYVGDTIDGDPLWCSRFLATDKEKCILAHRDLIRAGTQILTTASYQASVEGFMKYLGVDRMTAISLIKDSVIIARKAIELEEKEMGKKLNVLVAGSVGPYGAYLHDGSDYTGSYGNKVNKEELKTWHEPRIKALIEAGADIIGFETIPVLIEAEILIEILEQYPEKKAWLSFSCKDEKRISSGELFYDAAVKCWKLGCNQLIAVGVNCLNPSWVTPLFKKLKETHPNIPLIAYPNSGEKYDKEKGRWLDKTTSLSVTDYTEEWLELGINYIGGCCRTNDKDVKQFSEKIKNWRNKNK